MTQPETATQDPPAQDAAGAGVRAAGNSAAERHRASGADAQLVAENLRLRSAARQMQDELGRLGRQLEPLHGLTEQLDLQRRSYEDEQEKFRSELRRQEWMRHAEWQRREGEMLSALQRRDKDLQVALQRHRKQAEEQAEAERQRWSEERRGLLLEHERQVGEHRRLEQALHETNVRLADWDQRLRAVYASTSWRVSAPVRAAGRLFQSVRR